MRLTLFDLDGTLTPRDTEVEWATLLGERGLIDPTPHVKFCADYHRGELDLDAYFAWYTAILRSHELELLTELRDELVAERMLPSVPAVARGWLARARAESDAVLLVTASNHFLTWPIGAALGVDATLGTRYEERDGAFTGRQVGPACLREGKRLHVSEWLANGGLTWDDLTHSRFYSDSHNDLPLLEAVAEPIAVDPDPILARVAAERGWQVLSLGPESA
ncbi:HAD family hydrolase [Engelhardtia mirabilis]|uniref:Phosphoserine phosphatase n=1 Tax=Engelhardtia mirabilis TaxID=2528011 RepID=A0A518BSN5_9BACT|nr:Phosphoserine phosphatase [Planctomycetes bacterium Pla133]QDV04312.1 Phosphoserine phosphatase [Planctomycetes bacterium Pla86]